MKLVDILARELRGWPYDSVAAVQPSVTDDRIAFLDCLDVEFSIGQWDYKDPCMRIHDQKSSDFFTRAIDWKTAIVTRSEWQAAVDALNAGKVVEWAVGSLPPIGSVAEWAGCTFAPEEPQEKDLRIGDRVTIIAHLKDGDFEIAAFTFNPNIHNPARGSVWVNQGACGCFRPVRTPEQIAAEEREAAIKEMTHGHINDCLKDWAAYVYDKLGYRKQVTK